MENGVDFVQGVATALLPVTFFKVVMNKAFRALVDDRTEVSVETGLRAAEELQSVLDGRERGTDVLELKVQWARSSLRSNPRCHRSCGRRSSRSWMRRSSTRGRSAPWRTASMTHDDDPYDPTEFIDEDDEF